MDIKSLRKMGSADFGKLTQAAESLTQGGKFTKEEDARYWKLSADKAGNASATIRFLPRGDGDDLPWDKLIDHGFQGKNGKWYIEKSRASLRREDGTEEPVG